MPYDEVFYEKYEAYLNEPAVRKAHDWVFSIARLNPAFQRVIDLGCGQSREFMRWFCPSKYVGIDLAAPAADVREDYRHLVNLLAVQKYPALESWSAFVSLFSCEITGHFTDNYKLYNSLFVLRGETQAGLVSGFFYANHKEFTEVEEVGGITSYQTIEEIDDEPSAFFTEKRIILPVPSDMFGDDVFEVWKLFERV
jgi:hypothetical protein